MTERPLGFTSDTQVLNITTAASKDTLVVTLTNQSGGLLALRGGTPVAEAAITSASPSTVYLAFGAALTAEALHIAAPGWNAACFTGVFPSWGVCPAADLTLPNNGTVTFTITNMVVAGPPRPAQLNIDYYNMGSVANGMAQIKLHIQNAPAGRPNLSLTGAFLDGNTVYTTTDAVSPIENALFVTITNPSPTAPIVPAGVPWEASPPVFNISFVYGPPPGYGALTPVDLAATMSIAVVSTGRDDWTMRPHTQGDPYWTLEPTLANHEVLGVDAQASVELAITALRSDLPVGNAPDVTLMYVQYANIPGYNDGFLTLPITKLAGPAITSYYAEPASAPAGARSGPFTLYWSTTNAAAVTFDAPQIGPAFYASSGQGPLPNPVTLDAGQTITMTAYLTDPGSRTRAATPTRAGGLTQGTIAVRRSLDILTVSMATIHPGLDQLNLMVVTGGKAYQVQDWATGGRGAFDVHQFAEVTLASSSVSTFDFNSVIDPSEGTDNGLRTLCASPDGSAIYAFLGTNIWVFPGKKDLLIVALDTRTNAMKQVYKLPNESTWMPTAVTTEDGLYLYLSTWNMMAKRGDPLGGITVFDTEGFAVVKTYPWTPEFIDPGFLLAISPDGTKVYSWVIGNIVVIDVASRTIVTNLNISPPVPADYWFFAAPCMLSGRKRIFAGVRHSNGGRPCYLLVIDADPVTYAMQVSQQIDIGFPSQGGPETGAGPMALSADERTLYVWKAADTLLLVDTQTLVVQTVSCGQHPHPVVAVASDRSGVIYTSAGSDFTTMTLNGFGAGAPQPSRAPRARLARASAPREAWERVRRDEQGPRRPAR